MVALETGMSMNRGRAVIFTAALTVMGAGSSPLLAQTFQSYRCADRTQFIVAFFERDTRAHLQIDGHPVTLARRFALSGSRYSGGGVTLKITKTGVLLKHLR